MHIHHESILTLEMCGALDGTRPNPLPVGDGFLVEARFCVVVDHEFGLHLDRFGKAYLETLGNLLMILLPSTLEQ
jgi:hypothetical protein